MFGFGKRIKPKKPLEFRYAKPPEDYEDLIMGESLEGLLESFKKECEKKRKS
ncbi:MAG: hypothetical protein IJQ68_01655 [Methanobrevibacter sp.]|uniref:hypothetical protein n=1 Tax=Methanobrevibacter sp. TaxID=66852 RepID=UPI002600BDE3|nr:hypothetical protein [Methanobrevibacter sp.]MBR0270686.1 hypothetical protein [Methanobrevibacter sp.]